MCGKRSPVAKVIPPIVIGFIRGCPKQQQFRRGGGCYRYQEGNAPRACLFAMSAPEADENPLAPDAKQEFSVRVLLDCRESISAGFLVQTHPSRRRL